jgi:hypothetical protein
MPDVGEQIGKDYPTYIPSLIDIADIQNAFKDYHFGVVNYSGVEDIPPYSIEGWLNFLDRRLVELEDEPRSGAIIADNEPLVVPAREDHPDFLDVEQTVPYNVAEPQRVEYELPDGFIWVDGPTVEGDMKIVNYWGPTPPEADPILDLGALWINSDDLSVYAWNGTEWVQIVTQSSLGYDDTEVRGLIQDNADAIAALEAGGGSGYDDTAIRADVDQNTSTNAAQDLRLDALEAGGGGGGSYDDTQIVQDIADLNTRVEDIEYFNDIGRWTTSSTDSSDGFVKVTGTSSGFSINDVTELAFGSVDANGYQNVNEVYPNAILSAYIKLNAGDKYRRLDYKILAETSTDVFSVQQLTTSSIPMGSDSWWRIQPNTEGTGGSGGYDDTALTARVAATETKNTEQDTRLDTIESAGGGYDDTALAARVTATETTNATQDSRLDALENDTGYDDSALAARVTATETKNTEQDSRLDNLENDTGYDDSALAARVTQNEADIATNLSKNNEQDSRLNDLESAPPPASSLDNLTDVTLTSQTDGQALVYNGTSSQWENQSIAQATNYEWASRTAQFQTGTLTTGQVFTGTVNLNSTNYQLVKVTTSHAARTRLYINEFFRDEDIDRPVGELPVGENGLISEVVTTGSNLDIYLPVSVFGFNAEDPVNTLAAISVTNNDLFDQDLLVELEYYSVEVVPAGTFSVADSQSNTIHIKTNTSSSVWTGTQEQYDALSEYDVDTLYVVVD